MVDRDVPFSGAPGGSLDNRGSGGAPSGGNLETLSHHSRSPLSSPSTSAPETTSSTHNASLGHVTGSTGHVTGSTGHVTGSTGHMTTGSTGHMTTVESSAAMAAAMTSMALTASHTSLAGVNAASPFMLMDHRLRLPPGDDMKCHICGVCISLLYIY